MPGAVVVATDQLLVWGVQAALAKPTRVPRTLLTHGQVAFDGQVAVMAGMLGPRLGRDVSSLEEFLKALDAGQRVKQVGAHFEVDHIKQKQNCAILGVIRL